MELRREWKMRNRGIAWGISKFNGAASWVESGKKDMRHMGIRGNRHLVISKRAGWGEGGKQRHHLGYLPTL